MRRRVELLTVAMATTMLLASACRHGDDSRAAAPSEEAAANSSAATEMQHRSLTSGGRERTFLLYAPPDASPLPLVIALHGRLGDGAAEEKLSHFSRVAAKEHFVLALPDGYSRSWNDSRGVTPASKEKIDDVLFLTDLIDTLVKEKRVDPSRVYVTGMSNGGFMTETFACRAGDRVAAIATVGALLPDGFPTCSLAHAMPTLIIIGDKDPLVPYAGGEMGKAGERGIVKSADDTAKFWANANGCGTPTDSALPDTADDDTHTTITHYGSCRDGSEVSLFRVIGGGHTWPGGYQYFGKWAIGTTSRDFDASERIWAFFKGKSIHGT
jgi:polyhydroxybutyrate depolymerase